MRACWGGHTFRERRKADADVTDLADAPGHLGPGFLSALHGPGSPSEQSPVPVVAWLTLWVPEDRGLMVSSLEGGQMSGEGCVGGTVGPDRQNRP